MVESVTGAEAVEGIVAGGIADGKDALVPDWLKPCP